MDGQLRVFPGYSAILVKAAIPNLVGLLLPISLRPEVWVLKQSYSIGRSAILLSSFSESAHFPTSVALDSLLGSSAFSELLSFSLIHLCPGGSNHFLTCLFMDRRSAEFQWVLKKIMTRRSWRGRGTTLDALVSSRRVWAEGNPRRGYSIRKAVEVWLYRNESGRRQCRARLSLLRNY